VNALTTSPIVRAPPYAITATKTMPLDVFISFSRQDMGAAEKTCEVLEAAGNRCWMAHRDIMPGHNYLGATLEAVDCCRTVILVLSSNTNVSNAYLLERAATRGVPIIWLVLDHTAPPEEFTEFRQSAIVIDASKPPLELHFPILATHVKSLSARGFEQARISALAEGPSPASLPRPLSHSTSQPKHANGQNAALVLVGLVLLGTGAIFVIQIIGLVDAIIEYFAI